MSRLVPAALVLMAVGCGGGHVADPHPSGHVTLPRWEYDASLVFPADLSLMRAEDGVALPDGRLLVADQATGLRLVEPDGGSAPFGDMPGAGYRHDPAEHPGGANGVAMEPDGAHVLVADIHGGGIYRVNVETGATERIYRHRYGVNTAVRDSRGAVWFTQSAHNPPEEGESRMWAAVDGGLAEGALYRLPPDAPSAGADAELLVDGLQFGNGIVIDERAGVLYVAETMGRRVLRYRVDLDAGTLDERTVALEGVFPDNLELDAAGNLWVADPIANAVVVLDAAGESHTVFQVQTDAQRDLAAEIARRVDAGEPCLELITPDLWAPLPGIITGTIVGTPDGTVYATGLGNAVLRLPPPGGERD